MQDTGTLCVEGRSIFASTNKCVLSIVFPKAEPFLYYFVFLLLMEQWAERNICLLKNNHSKIGGKGAKEGLREGGAELTNKSIE